MRGIRKTPTGWQVFARRDGTFYSKRFKLETSIETLNRERDKLIGRAVLPEIAKNPEGKTLAEDAADYLALVTGMPSYPDRVYDIGQWVAVLGEQVRSAITSKAMRAALETWRISGRANGTGGLSNGSLNRRRTALMHLYTVLDGKAAANPVKDVPAYSEAHSEQIRSIDPKILHRIIRKIAHHRRRSKTRARLRLMFWTGWPQAQIMRLTPADIDWDAEDVWMPGRKKGTGSKARRLPLVAGHHAVAALRRFAALNAWGQFSTSGMHKSFQRAVAAVNAERAKEKLPPVKARPYDVRHTFGTELAKRLKDERAIQELMLLTNPSQVRRYTDGATSDRLEAARLTLAGAKVATSQNRVASHAKR